MGHTSIVFKLELTNGNKAAFKPNAKKVRDRYRGEIAAYRFAVALGIPNVPPACFRTFDVASLSNALAGSDRDLLRSDLLAEQHRAKGALIPWIGGLTFWEIDKAPLRDELRGWLTAGATIPPSEVDRARQASILVAFDFMTGNWDRYSGGNVGLDRTRDLVLFIDNDAAFMQEPPRAELEQNKARLDATDRFSRSFIERVRAIDDAAIKMAIGDEEPGESLVSPSVIATVAQRVKELVGIVDAKIAARGGSETLYFR